LFFFDSRKSFDTAGDGIYNIYLWNIPVGCRQGVPRQTVNKGVVPMSPTKNRMPKILLRLLIILVLVLAAALAVKHFRADQEETAGGSSSGESLTTSIQLAGPDAVFSALSFSNGTITLSFSQDETGAWYWDGDKEFPLDTACINAIMTELATLEPVMAITDGETLETYGLGEETFFLTAQYPDGTRLHLDFGSKTPDGSALYALMDDDPDTVYVLDTDIPTRLDTAIYDMMLLPELPQLDESDFSSVTVRGTVNTMMVAFIAHTEAPSSGNGAASSAAVSSSGSAGAAETTLVSWRAEGANVSDSRRLQNLISDLSHLSLARCENFKPSDQAVTAFGLNAPSAVVEITYGTDQFLSLTVGNETLAGGAYYVRLADDTTIYSMDAAMLDTALTVAAYGLEGNLPEPADEIPADDIPAEPAA